MTPQQHNRLLIRLRPVFLLLPVALPGGFALMNQSSLASRFMALSPDLLGIGGLIALVAWILYSLSLSMRIAMTLIPYEEEKPLYSVAIPFLALFVFAAYIWCGLKFAHFIDAHARDLISMLP